MLLEPSVFKYLKGYHNESPIPEKSINEIIASGIATDTKLPYE
jgi:hypothetical protein